MTESLRRLMQHPIDYAGLFAPANLDMRAALAEYGTAMDSEDEWIINRFLCPVERLGECFETLDEFEDKGTGKAPWLDFGVIAAPLVSGATSGDRIRHDITEVKMAFQHGDVTTYEVKVPMGSEFDGCLGAVKSNFDWFDGRDVEVYVEMPLGEGMGEAMAAVSSRVDGAGFKVRTGGAAPEHFPDSRSLANFISEVAGLESTFKFTAGLHHPLRQYDSDLSCYHHGFLNVMVGSALATTQSATSNEVEQILNIQEPSDFIFTDKSIEVQGHSLSLKDIDEWWLYFGGYGSCTYREQIDGLRALGWA